MLAAIDHNTNIKRSPALSVSGQLKYSKVYSKRSKNWRVSLVKEDKSYDYWPVLSSRILGKRIGDDENITRKVVLPPDHPKHIAPSIAMQPIPKTSDLVQQSLSRFSGSQLMRVSSSPGEVGRSADDTPEEVRCEPFDESDD